MACSFGQKQCAIKPPHVKSIASFAVLRIKTGFNDAYYVDTETRQRLVTEDPRCKPIIHRLLRGRTIARWLPAWNGDWMIGIPSSLNQVWPWSECDTEHEAEGLFRETYPSLHAHLKTYEPKLRARQDKGRYWWELRACDFYDALQNPKIVVQQILFHSGFALDTQSYWVNNSAYLLPIDDLYLLALLNSRVIWWYLSRTWPHMKDEALSVQKPALLALPIPKPSSQLRMQIEELVQQAKQLIAQESALSELLIVELQLNECVTKAFALSGTEIGVLENSLPLRDPLVVLEKRIRSRLAGKE